MRFVLVIMSVTAVRMVILSGLKSKRRPWHLSRGSYLESNGFDEFQKVWAFPGPPKRTTHTKKGGVSRPDGAPKISKIPLLSLKFLFSLAEPINVCSMSSNQLVSMYEPRLMGHAHLFV